MSQHKSSRKPAKSRHDLAGPLVTKLEFDRLEDRVVPAGIITGNVFQDFNANGIFNVTPPLINNDGGGTIAAATDVLWTASPIDVLAFDGNNTVVAQTTTTNTGTYSLNVTGTGPYRVEFRNLPAGVFYGPTAQTGFSATRFVADPNGATTTGVNLPLIRAEDVSPNNPLLVTNCYVFGAADGLNADSPVVIGFRYSSGESIANPGDQANATNNGNNGTPIDQIQGGKPASHNEISIPQSQVGTTWGLAQSSVTQQLFMAAYTKRHTGYGPAGNDAIYLADPAVNGLVSTATPFLKLGAGAAGVDYRQEARWSVIPPTGPVDNPYFYDGLYRNSPTDNTFVGWDAVGKTGLGGLATDPSGTKLYTVGLNDKQLYVIDVATKAVTTFTLPTPASVTGQGADLRPFAVEYYRGDVYVGAVNSAETTQSDTDLKAYVFKFNVAANGFVNQANNATTTEPVIEFSLNYPRGYIHPGITDQAQANQLLPAEWNPWSPVLRNLADPDFGGAPNINPNTNANNDPNTPIGTYAQPMLTGLTFDSSGNITIGIRDRSSDQFGVYTPVDIDADITQTSEYRVGISGGDTLRAFGNPAAGWVLESNGTNPNDPATASNNGVNNGQGLGGGEFFAGEYLKPGLKDGVQDHQEVSLGGVLQIAGFPDVVVTVFDPLQAAGRVNTGGVRWFADSGLLAGDAVKAYEIYQSPQADGPLQGGQFPQTFAKANGLGDLIKVSTAPVEVGNRLWNDLNRNGLQDANEPGIVGANVQLYKDGQLIGEAITNGQGEYYFTNMPAPANPAANARYGIAQLMANMDYEIRVPLTQGALQAFTLTTQNVISGNPQLIDERIDSDAALVNDVGVIAFNTNGQVGGIHFHDMGVTPGLSIGDYVWDDVNNNGMVDAGEPGIEGVRVELYNADTNAFITATATNASGGYLFPFLAEGNYRVQIPLGNATNQPNLIGYLSSTGTPGSGAGPFEPAVPTDVGNNKDNGTTLGAFIVGPTINLVAGEAPTNDPANPPTGLVDSAPDNNSDRSMDFGLTRVVSIGDVVWIDANNNGMREANEAGLAGVTVQLLDGQGNVIRDQQTNANGGYLFDLLVPGDYQIRLVRDAALAGYVSSTGQNGSLTGPFEPAGNPENDKDHGTQSDGFITGPIINALIGNAPLGETATAPAGLPAELAIDSNSYRNQDFGVFQPLSLGDLVFNDANNNGVRDAGEAGIGGVVVRLLDGVGNPVIGIGGTPIQTTTTANGGYLFSNLSTGQYQIEVVTPAGLTSSTGSPGSQTGPFEPSNSTVNNTDTGTIVGGVVRGRVVTLAPGLAPTDDLDGPTVNDPATNANSDLTHDFGFFAPPPPPPPPPAPASLSGNVYFDPNNNGVYEPALGEVPIPGTTIILEGVDAAGNPLPQQTTTTDANGFYQFLNLAPGTYRVIEVQPAGFNDGQDILGNVDGTPRGVVSANDVQSGITLNAGDAGVQYNFFEIPVPVPPPVPPPVPASLSGNVYFDPNNNGVYEPALGEVPIPGTTIFLDGVDAAGNPLPRQTTTTNANGFYQFLNLAPGTYTVIEVQPAGFLDGQDILGNVGGTPRGVIVANDVQTSIVLGAGEAGVQYNFFELPPATTPASISGTVYFDSPNTNGLYEPGLGERGIPGTRVTLTGVTADGVTIEPITTITDRAGNYIFPNLQPGTYKVTETQPASYIDGIDTIGTVGGVARGTTTNDMHADVTLNSGDVGINYNFGETPINNLFGFVWVDLNRNGVFDGTEPPIPGVPITLSGTLFPGTPLERPLTAADVPGGLTVLTNSVGRYDFTNLPNGNYTVRETQPVDFLDFMEQDGDPLSPRPVIANDVFSQVLLTGFQTRGPFNFGEVFEGSGQPPQQRPGSDLNDPSKRQFLGSTSRSNGPSDPQLPPDQLSPGVVAPVLSLPLDPNFNALIGDPALPSIVVAGSGPGTSPIVRVFDYGSGLERSRIMAYETNYTGGVRVATGDVNGDGQIDVVTATGVGGGPRIRVFDAGQPNRLVHDFFAYESTYMGGVNLAIGDVNGDGIDDIITGTEMGGGPRVRVLDGKTLSVIQDFFAFAPEQRGGVRIALADFDGDGRDDIIATTGAGVATRVRVFNSATMQIIQDFAPYETDFTGGSYVAAGDFNGDGTPDIVTGTDVGGGPRVQIFDGRSLNVIANQFVYEPSFTGGVRVAATDLNRDGISELITGAGIGGGSRISIFSGVALGKVDDFFAFDNSVNNGVFVGAGEINPVSRVA